MDFKAILALSFGIFLIINFIIVIEFSTRLDGFLIKKKDNNVTLKTFFLDFFSPFLKSPHSFEYKKQYKYLEKYKFKEKLYLIKLLSIPISILISFMYEFFS